MKITPEIKANIRMDREQSGMTLPDLVKKYGFSKSSIFLIIKDCDASNVKMASPRRRVVKFVAPLVRPGLSKSDLGEAARQMICARLMLNGIKVFRPVTEDTAIDLLVLKGDGKIAKCQCKYIFPVSRGSHNMNLCSVRKTGSFSRPIRHRYPLSEVDFFLGYCLDNDGTYVIPNIDTKGVMQLAFWILRDKLLTNKNGLDMSQYKNNFALLK